MPLSYPVWNLSVNIWEKCEVRSSLTPANCVTSLRHFFPKNQCSQNNLGVHQKQTKVLFTMAIDDHSSLAFELILQPSALNDKLLSRQKTVNAQGTVLTSPNALHFSQAWAYLPFILSYFIKTYSCIWNTSYYTIFKCIFIF